MPETTEKTLRERFLELNKEKFKQQGNEFTKDTAKAIDLMSDWWLLEFNKVLSEIEEKIGDMNKPIPCDCPKGGLVGENEYSCDKCGGTQWMKNHICVFNDGEQHCVCYERSIGDALKILSSYKSLE